jgi:hypothetical protein
MVTTAPAQTSATSARKRAPWRGRPRAANPKGKRIALRCTVEDHALIAEWAVEAGLSTGGYLRALALGSAGPRAVKRPQAECELLARILGELASWDRTSTRPPNGQTRNKPRRASRSL